MSEKQIEYVTQAKLDWLKKSKIDGKYYTYNDILRTVETSDFLFKNPISFKKKNETEEQAILKAEECMHIWKCKDYKGSPSSPASFFRKEIGKLSQVKVSYNNVLQGYVHGGWQEAFKTGAHVGQLWYYDINKAYYWACFDKLPLKLKPWQKGDRNFLCIFKPDKKTENRGDLPKYFEKKYFLATNIDIEFYGLTGTIKSGVAWRSMDCNLKQRIDNLQFLPSDIWKQVTQSYWGMFMARGDLEIDFYQNGSKKNSWTLWNSEKNFVWSTIIQHRIMRRVWQVAKVESLLVFVDSVLTERQIDTGKNPGQWKLEREFSEGVYIQSVGLWNDLLCRTNAPREWYKHAGVS